MTMTRYDVSFVGRVQGVFFRATAVEIARGFDVTGWVRNEADGSVRCVAEGEPEELERFVAAVQEAKRRNLEAVRITRADATGEFTGFAVRG